MITVSYQCWRFRPKQPDILRMLQPGQCIQYVCKHKKKRVKVFIYLNKDVQGYIHSKHNQRGDGVHLYRTRRRKDTTKNLTFQPLRWRAVNCNIYRFTNSTSLDCRFVFGEEESSAQSIDQWSEWESAQLQVDKICLLQI